MHLPPNFSVFVAISCAEKRWPAIPGNRARGLAELSGETGPSAWIGASPAFTALFIKNPSTKISAETKVLRGVPIRRTKRPHSPGVVSAMVRQGPAKQRQHIGAGGARTTRTAHAELAASSSSPVPIEAPKGERKTAVDYVFPASPGSSQRRARWPTNRD